MRTDRSEICFRRPCVRYDYDEQLVLTNTFSEIIRNFFYTDIHGFHLFQRVYVSKLFIHEFDEEKSQRKQSSISTYSGPSEAVGLVTNVVGKTVPSFISPVRIRELPCQINKGESHRTE